MPDLPLSRSPSVEAPIVGTREFRHGRMTVQLDYRYAPDGRLRFVTICPVGEATMSPQALAALIEHLRAGAESSPAQLVRVSGTGTERTAMVVYTSALTIADAETYTAAGFAVRSELALLTKPLVHRPFIDLLAPLHRTSEAGSTGSGSTKSGSARQVDRACRIVRGRTEHLPAAAAIDAAAFGVAWTMDAHDLGGALAATHSSCLHLAVCSGDQPVGFAITGRSGRRGYLQRLAVHPDAQGRGIGRELVDASSRWAARRDVRRLIVNTQKANITALRLYERAGFVHSTLGLVLLQMSLAGDDGRSDED